MHLTASGEYLWAMDLAENQWPVAAHLIGRVEQGKFGEVRWSECGRSFTSGTHPWGWYSTRPGELPIAGHAVHCGRETAATATQGADAAEAMGSTP